MENLVTQHYSHISPDIIVRLRTALLGWITSIPKEEANPPYIRNKVAQFITILIQRQYPHNWKTAFKDVLAITASKQPAQIDMFLRIIAEVNAQIFSPDSSTNPQSISQFKEWLKADCLINIMSKI